MNKFCVLAVLFVLCLPVYSTENLSTFSIAVLPDTQKYSRYNALMFDAQTQWIVDKQAQMNIVFTAHLGDIVEKPTQPYQWDNADHSLSILESAKLPYSVLAGNHDLLNATQNDAERDSENEPFLYYFPVERARQNPSYGGHSPTKFNSYYIFEFEGQQFLVFALDWRLSESSMAWVQSILDDHANIPTIITTHDLVNVDKSGTVYLTRYGQGLWDRLIASNNQIFLTINGHHHGVGHTILKNNQGYDVLVMLVNYQTDYNGGNGMMRLLTFDLSNNMIHAESFSPYVMNIPPEDRDNQDKERKTDPSNKFSIAINILNRVEFMSSFDT